MKESDKALKIEEVLGKLVQNDFRAFLMKSFYTLNPNKKYYHSWYIDLIVEYLKAIENGEIKRLIINIPPRNLKSICVSVAWPAWLLAKQPSNKIIAVSYNTALSKKHSEDCRRILYSDWYKRYYPRTKILKGDNTKSKYLTTKNGFRFATSIGATLTGEGGDYIIIDDPMTPLQAIRKNEQKKVISWFDQTLSTRLDDKKKGAIILIMQRLHIDDLAGYLIKKGSWELLKLPAIFEQVQSFQINDFRYDAKIGELLNPKREGLKQMKLTKEELGSYAFSAQYQQNPISNNNIFKKEHIKRYQKLPDFLSVYQSWDCAIKIGVKNDYSVCTTWGVMEHGYYLLSVYRKKLEYFDLKESIKYQYSLYNPEAVLIEDKASGQQLLQDLKATTNVPLIGILPRGNKTVRCLNISYLFETGKIFLPEKAEWLINFELELSSFPDSANDDQVDSMTQFLIWSKRAQNTSFNLRRL